MLAIIVSIAAAIAMWGGWPLVARAAGEQGLTGALLLSVFSLLVVLAGSAVTPVTLPATPALATLAVAGVMMGLGLVAFNAATTSPLVEVSTVVPIIDTGMLLVSVVGGILFFDESVTVRKMVAVAFLVTGIVLLGPSLSANASR